MASYLRDWRGHEVRMLARKSVSLALSDIGMKVEKLAKHQLYPGHGYITGTLKRSIHNAQPGYDWPGDSLEATESTPERGGKPILPKWQGSRGAIEVGSGQYYAIFVHQGHHSFSGYHYLTLALRLVIKRHAKAIIRKYTL